MLLAAAQRNRTLGSDSVNRRLPVSNGEKNTQEARSHPSLASPGAEIDGRGLNVVNTMIVTLNICSEKQTVFRAPASLVIYSFIIYSMITMNVPFKISCCQQEKSLFCNF